MAFWGGGGATSQVMTVADWRFFCGREAVTVAFWVRIASQSVGSISFLRQDQTSTPFQLNGNNARALLWHGTGGTGTQQTVLYAATSAHPTNEWIFCAQSYGRPNYQTFRWRSSTMTAELMNSTAWGNPVVTKTTANLKPFVIGGHETSGELMRTNDAIAELSVYPFAVQLADIHGMATAPELWRQKAAFYLPMRAPAAASEPCNGFRRQRIILGSASADRFTVGGHPPVPYLGLL